MQFGELELAVMQLYWEESPLSTPEIYDVIAKQKDVAYTTIKTVIDRLEKKKALCRVRQEGRTIFYSPLIKKSTIRETLVHAFVDKVFNGDSSELVIQLLKDKRPSKKNIEFIKQLLQDE